LREDGVEESFIFDVPALVTELFGEDSDIVGRDSEFLGGEAAGESSCGDEPRFLRVERSDAAFNLRMAVPGGSLQKLYHFLNVGLDDKCGFRGGWRRSTVNRSLNLIREQFIVNISIRIKECVGDLVSLGSSDFDSPLSEFLQELAAGNAVLLPAVERAQHCAALDLALTNLLCQLRKARGNLTRDHGRRRRLNLGLHQPLHLLVQLEIIDFVRRWMSELIRDRFVQRRRAERAQEVARGHTATSVNVVLQKDVGEFDATRFKIDRERCKRISRSGSRLSCFASVNAQEVPIAELFVVDGVRLRDGCQAILRTPERNGREDSAKPSIGDAAGLAFVKIVEEVIDDKALPLRGSPKLADQR
jgi:hypothetical protein